MIILLNKIEKFLKENELLEKEEIKIALTHKSTGNENYEKLELIGDAVLGLCIVNYLYKNFPNYDVGKLAKIKSFLVSKEILYKIGKENNIFNYIKYSKALTKTQIKQNKRIISDVVEALIGAIYIIKGYELTEKFILNLYEKYLKNIDDIKEFDDYKSKLQIIVNRNFKNELPVYELTKTKGEEHNKIFFISVKIKNKIYGNGKGKNIKEAEQNAAKIAIKNLLKEGIK